MKRTRWSHEKGWRWHDKQPWLVGCNFLPSTAVNDTEMWQGETYCPETIDRELGWAAGLGFNSVRVFLQYVVWDADPAGFLQRMERFCEIAASHGLSVMPILFDDCCFSGRQPYLGRQDDPLPGVHNSGWVPSPGKDIATDKSNWLRLEQYVAEVVGRFADDPRVVVWDLYNEPGAGDEFDSRELLSATFEWARAAKAKQPLTAGVFRGKLDGSATLDQIAEADDCARIMLENSNILSFHNYCDLEFVRGCIRTFRAAGRPLICTEWMARGPMQSFFRTHLPVWKAEKIGCYSWGLVAGRTQTYYPWKSPAGAPKPEVWHHDILRADGTPFDAAEVEVIRKVTSEA